MTSEIKVDTISENTSANGVTIDGLTIKDGNIIGDVALAGTTPTFTIGDAGAEDAALIFDGNAVDYYIALDDSADNLIIGSGSTVGSNSLITIDSDGDFTFTKASSGASATSGTVLTVEDDDNTELSILGGSSSVLAINFGHSGDNDEGKITFNTTAGSEDLQLVSSKEITLDAAGDIILDADGGDIRFKDAGTEIGALENSSSDLQIKASVQDKDIIFRGNDGGTGINALVLDMSAAGAATFNAGFTAQAASTITTADNTDTLTLISTDADATQGPVLNLYRNSSAVEDDNDIARINFTGNDSGGNATTYASTRVIINDVTDGTEDTQIIHSQMIGGAFVSTLRCKPDEIVINDSSIDLDFRVESNGDVNALFVDAGNDRVGFFTNSPDNQIDLKRAGSAIMKIESTNNGDDAKLLLKKAGSSSRNMVGFVSDNTWHVGHLRNATTTFSIATNDDSNSSNEFRVTASGVLIAGSLSKGSGSFKIEHPHSSKKDTHNLVHSFLEGPQADLIYRGKVDLVGGSATVNVDTVSGMTDGTFVLLNTDVQCFTSNETGWTAVKGSVSGNILTITAEDNSCTDTISWMVVGERHDQHMKDTDWTDDDGKVIVEPLKEIEEV